MMAYAMNTELEHWREAKVNNQAKLDYVCCKTENLCNSSMY